MRVSTPNPIPDIMLNNMLNNNDDISDGSGEHEKYEKHERNNSKLVTNELFNKKIHTDEDGIVNILNNDVNNSVNNSISNTSNNSDNNSL
jgi:hypothetical protein